jgi:hypothetical protein
MAMAFRISDAPRKRKKVPIELLVRYKFVPLEETQHGKVADPGQLLVLDRTKRALNRAIVTKVSRLRG